MQKIIIGLFIGFVALFASFASAALTSIFTWFAWNLFMPSVFHLPQISLLQAFAFNILAGQFRSYVMQKKD